MRAAPRSDLIVDGSPGARCRGTDERVAGDVQGRDDARNLEAGRVGAQRGQVHADGVRELLRPRPAREPDVGLRAVRGAS
jgi:hypothetical protein